MLNSVEISDTFSNKQNIALNEIERLDHNLRQHFKTKFVVQPSLTRSLVSFQANKTRPVYRWYKYKEAFSASLVEHLFQKHGVTQGKILDPFAGSGTALFAASALGFQADGIELLPIGQQIITTKQLLETKFTSEDFEALRRWPTLRIWEQSATKVSIPELRITQGAYPAPTKEAIGKFIGACRQENSRVQAVLRFALLCVLESISYTRKDGQYLRWDYRSGRRQGQKPFDKGEILTFEQAISDKINEILSDLAPATKQLGLFPVENSQGDIQLFNSSCLEIMPNLPDCTYDAIITSPPYCNRYDYTRTYALELALLGIAEKELVRLRQEMLSCTVENRAKDLLKINPRWITAIAAADEHRTLTNNYFHCEKQRPSCGCVS